LCVCVLLVGSFFFDFKAVDLLHGMHHSKSDAEEQERQKPFTFTLIASMSTNIAKIKNAFKPQTYN
jgi:hypothetical protein